MDSPAKKTKNRLFGTDGIRSTFGEYPLDRESIIKLGNALDRLPQGNKIVIGRDTRRSGEEIVRLLASGKTGGMELYDLGVIPTPGLSYITDHGDFDYGIMVTASHNPWTDNGIKIFKSDGEKILEALERQVEEFFFTMDRATAVTRAVVPADPGAGAVYRDFLSGAAGQLAASAASRQRTFKIILDCANGAAFEEAPAVFGVLRRAGFDVEVMGNLPDGKNINLRCGSTHMDELAGRVKAKGADLGIAFDGDADRVLMVDREGHILDGDHTLYLIAKYFLETDENFNKTVVGTVMGNLGLEKALNGMGITYVRTDVGDKYVYEEMKNRDALLGGEQSGHTILRALQKTGDGILTALYFLRALFYFDMEPGDVFRALRLYPQEMKSITVREKPPLENWAELNREIETFNAAHGTGSRVLIRYSGTEPKIRVMIESRDKAVIRENMGKFEEFIKSTIGI